MERSARGRVAVADPRLREGSTRVPQPGDQRRPLRLRQAPQQLGVTLELRGAGVGRDHQEGSTRLRAGVAVGCHHGMSRLAWAPALLLAALAWAAEPPKAALEAATRGGKYADLKQAIEVRADLATYGEVHDWGSWGGTHYAGHTVAPGYWVYVYPHWFIFAQKVKDTPPESARPGTPGPSTPEPPPPPPEKPKEPPTRPAR